MGAAPNYLMHRSPHNESVRFIERARRPWAFAATDPRVMHVIEAILAASHSDSVDVVTLRSYSECVRFEWDEAKRRSNIEKHGVDFAEVAALFAGYTVTVLDDRFDYAEYRFITVGILGANVLTVAHTETDEVIRIISARQATLYEEEQYYEALAGEGDPDGSEAG